MCSSLGIRSFLVFTYSGLLAFVFFRPSFLPVLWGCLGQRSDRELPAIPDEFDPSLLYSHISRQRPSGREASPPTVSKTDVFQLIPTCSFPPLLSIYIVVSFVYRVHALGME